MIKTTTIFHGSDLSEYNSELRVMYNSRNEIYIEVSHSENGNQWVCLDKPTAIKLTRVLRAEISKING